MTYSTFQNKANQKKTVAEPVSAKQVQNTQGFYVYKTSDMDQLKRFLILGTTAPTYHAGTSNVQKNVDLIKKLIASEKGLEVVHTVFQMDKANLLIRKGPAIFVLAYALKHGDLQTRKYVAENAVYFLRTGRDIAGFVEEVEGLGGGWGRLTRNAVSKWYQQDVDKVAYQVVKYRNTGQFEHRNLLRLAHPEPVSGEHNNLYKYIVGKPYDHKAISKQVLIFESLKEVDTVEEVLSAIAGGNMTHEMIPTQFKSEPKVWYALAKNMPYRALVWNLSTFSRLEMLKPLSDFEQFIVDTLTNVDKIKGSKIHPFTLLVALRNYQQGKGHRNTWSVNKAVVDALSEAFDLSLSNVEKTGMKYGLIVDTSGSMSSNWNDYGYGGKGGGTKLSGSNIKPIEGAAAMAVVQSRQGRAHIIGVDSTVHNINLSGKSGLSEALQRIGQYRGGRTDLGAGMKHFINNNVVVDCIIFYTDNEVNQGYHVAQLFDQYKARVNKNAKMIVVGFEASDFSIADSSRGDMLDICGFDMSAPQVIDNFIKGF